MITAKQYFTQLQKHLTRLCITHAELAREAKVDKTQLSRWFSGRVQNPTLQTVHKLDRALSRLKKRGAGCEE
jgi:transcriptional regulator with XRE-family HTH domain